MLLALILSGPLSLLRFTEKGLGGGLHLALGSLMETPLVGQLLGSIHRASLGLLLGDLPVEVDALLLEHVEVLAALLEQRYTIVVDVVVGDVEGHPRELPSA